MSRYIDADALVDKLLNAIECGKRVDMPTSELEAVLNDVKTTSSIDIVRCSECRFSVSAITAWSNSGENNSVERLCKVNSHNVNDNDFCSYGQTERSSE